MVISHSNGSLIVIGRSSRKGPDVLFDFAFVNMETLGEALPTLRLNRGLSATAFDEESPSQLYDFGTTLYWPLCKTRPTESKIVLSPLSVSIVMQVYWSRDGMRKDNPSRLEPPGSTPFATPRQRATSSGKYHLPGHETLQCETSYTETED